MNKDQKDAAYRNFILDNKKHGKNEQQVKSIYPSRTAKKIGQRTRVASTRTKVIKKK